MKLLAIPLIRKLPIMTAVKMPTGREYPAILRKIYLITLVPAPGAMYQSRGQWIRFNKK